ncbi:MAG: SdiA-regulated domain-containing protein, partial [Bacteroidota bacterium]
GTQYAITEEKRRHLALVDINAITLNINYAAATIIQLPQAATNNQGIEGVAYDPLHELLYSIKELAPMTIHQTPHPNSVSHAVLPDYAFDLGISTMTDVSGLHHLAISDAVADLGVQDHILILSDQSRRLEERDARGNLISTLDLGNGGANGTLAAQLAQAEGICMDEHGEILVLSEPNTWYRFANPNWNTLLGNTRLAYRATGLNATGHTLPAATLDYSTQYCWRVRGRRVYEWSDWSGWQTFTTEPNPDNVPPTQPINLVSPSQTATTVDLTWTTSTDNVGVVGYYIYVDGVLYDSSAVNSATVYGLAFNTFYNFEVAAYDAAGNISARSPVLLASTLPNLSPPVTLTYQISNSSDDAEEYISNGVVDLTSTDLELGNENGNLQYIGLRFPNVNLPLGSVIINAYVQFTVDEATTVATNTTIRAQDAANPITFSLVNTDISSRPLTTASVNWSPVLWNVVGQAGPNQQTPNLNTVLQEVVNRPDWAPGQAIAIVIEGLGGRRTAEAYDGSPSDAAVLVIEYAEGAGPVLSASEVGLSLEQLDCQNRLDVFIQEPEAWEEVWIERASDDQQFFLWQELAREGSELVIFDERPHFQSYYRMAMRDRSGQLHYSKVCMGQNQCETWDVFPNPSTGDQVYVELGFAERERLILFELFDSHGRSVLRMSEPMAAGQSQMP